MSTTQTLGAVDARLQRTYGALVEAATRLLDEHPVSDISITRLVDEAGVTRPTFYQHFPDIPAIARAAALTRLAAASPIPEPIPAGLSLAELREVIAAQFLPDLEHLAHHRDFYLRVLDGAADLNLLTALVTLSLDRTTPEPFAQITTSDTTADDVRALIAGGTTWLVITWLRDGDRPLDTLAHRLADTIVEALTADLRP